MSARITMAHGGGGRATAELVDSVFRAAFRDPELDRAEDQAILDLAPGPGERLAFTTDSYVVRPLEFPGGDIGKLAVCGTVNDLAVGGARPLYLSCAVILEEGLDSETLRRIVASMAQTARDAGVRVVTGDTKVVERGAADGLYLNTAGVGIVPAGRSLGLANARAGDRVLVSGPLGDHGAAILEARAGLTPPTGSVGPKIAPDRGPRPGRSDADVPETHQGGPTPAPSRGAGEPGPTDRVGGVALRSDCAAVHGLVEALLAAAPGVRAMRDPTRGGLAAVANELAAAAKLGVELTERAIPVREEVRAICEILGLDPLYLASEGRIVVVVPPAQAGEALAALRAHPLGEGAAEIGQLRAEHPGRVILRSPFGGARVLDMLVGEQLPRIC